MAEYEEPALEFVNDHGHLRFQEETVKVHKIVRDIIRASMLSAGKKVRIAFFYQNDSFDAAIPYCLEMLYQANVISKKGRNKVLLFCGKQYSYLKESYKDVFYGYYNYCNTLFGLGVVSPRGSIKEEKKIYEHRSRSKKEAEDKVLFSSSYSFFPNEEVANSVACIVIIAPALSSMHKIPQICQWCEKNEIPTIAIFDPFPTARKIRFYGNLSFIAYGWGLDEMKEAAMSAPTKDSTPISNSKRLMVLSDFGDVEQINLGHSEVSILFNSLNTALAEAHSKTGHEFFERDMVMEAASLSRRLAALSTPLLEYDKEYFGSAFRKSLSEKVDNFISMIESAGGSGGVSSEMGKAAYYLAEIKNKLAYSNPKFDEMVTQVGGLISRGTKGVILIPSQLEASAFKNALANLKVPIKEEDLLKTGIEIKSFSANKAELENTGYAAAILSTYPFLDKKYLLCTPIAKKIKMVLYPYEISDYKFFNSLYSQIEEKFFTKSRRAEIQSFLSGKSELKDLNIARVVRNGDKAEAKLENVHRKPKDILSVLTDIEESLDVSAPSLLQEAVSKDAIKKTESGEIRINGLLIKFTNGDKIYVRAEKTVQVLSASDDLDFKLTKDLKIGETMILINRDVRMSLNELILEKAEEYPKLKVLSIMVSLWVNALKEGMLREKDSEETLLGKMNSLGASLESKYTIYHWVNGEVIGPRDLKNILRIAKIYNCTDLEKNAEAVAASITQMRGLRKTILRRAKNALMEGESEEIEKLGIDLSDFADAIEFFRVDSIEKVDGIPLEQLDKIGGGYEI